MEVIPITENLLGFYAGREKSAPADTPNALKD